jgi:putative SOS response-associated peptidase YedK
MPVILPKEVEDLWLDPSVADHYRLRDLLRPYPSEEMDGFVVSNLVNSVKNDSPTCIEPISTSEREPLRLF